MSLFLLVLNPPKNIVYEVLNSSMFFIYVSSQKGKVEPDRLSKTT